MLDGR